MKIFKNLIIYLNEALLSNCSDSGITKIKFNFTFKIINNYIIKGKNKCNLKINVIIGLVDKNNYIKIDINIYEYFIFLYEIEKNKFEQIYMEILLIIV